MYESPKGSMVQAIKNFGLAKKRHYEKPDQFGFPKRKKYLSKRSFYQRWSDGNGGRFLQSSMESSC